MKRFPAAALGWLLGCQPGFESPSLVRDLRILGMRGEPSPEVVVDYDPEEPLATVFPEVDVLALLADPGEERALSWCMTACPTTRSARCDDPEAPRIELGCGTVADPDGPYAEVLRATLTVDPRLIRAAVQADDLLGFGGVAVQVALRVGPEAAPVVGSKRIVYAPRLPAERVANQNPSLSELRAGDAVLAQGSCRVAGAGLKVMPGAELALAPVAPDGVRESYVLPTFDGGARRLTENLTYSWFATAGELSSERSGGPVDAFGNQPPLDVTWTAPQEPGLVSLWLVQRDERLGVSWTQHCIEVAAR